MGLFAWEHVESPQSGIKSMSPALADRHLSTEISGKSKTRSFELRSPPWYPSEGFLSPYFYHGYKWPLHKVSLNWIVLIRHFNCQVTKNPY